MKTGQIPLFLLSAVQKTLQISGFCYQGPKTSSIPQFGLRGANNIDIYGVFCPEGLQKLARARQTDAFWGPGRITAIINKQERQQAF